MVENKETLPINKQKQKTAFPPNFVHSLDASHMFLTCIECKEINIDFASVHDSFWTHPCDVDKLNVIIRDKFIELHSKPILEDLIRDFKLFNPEIVFPTIPSKGDLDLNSVKDSLYFFD
jgi:DNA-directed RNA polymerase, mitochondrial